MKTDPLDLGIAAARSLVAEAAGLPVAIRVAATWEHFGRPSCVHGAVSINADDNDGDVEARRRGLAWAVAAIVQERDDGLPNPMPFECRDLDLLCWHGTRDGAKVEVYGLASDAAAIGIAPEGLHARERRVSAAHDDLVPEGTSAERAASHGSGAGAPSSPLRWCRFPCDEDDAIAAWTEDGHIAVVVLGFDDRHVALGLGALDALARGEDVALLLGPDDARLDAAALAIGCPRHRLADDRGRRRYELNGPVLERALALCAGRPT